MSSVAKPIALDESINTTENTPRNIADVLADELSNIADKIQGGGSGGSGGHIIQNSQGANLTQRGTMQFVDSHATDNSAGEKTVIENIKSVTEAQFESATEDGLYDVDVEGAEIGEISEEYVEVEADGNKTYAQLLNGLYADADLTKVNVSTTKLKIGSSIFNIFGLSNYECYFSASSLNSQLPATEEIRVSSSSYYNRYRQGQFSDLSSTKPSSGTKITLYYGNDKAVVDLQTTANRCLMSNEESVQDYISPIGNHQIEYIPFGKGWNGKAYTFIPLLNANKYTITITSAVVYNGGSSAVDITSSVAIGNKTRDGFNIEMTSNTYVGECVRLSFTVS